MPAGTEAAGRGLDRAQTAIERGVFQDSAGKVVEEAMLAAAEDVAYGMRLLHTNDTVHGSLCATSILLAAQQARFQEPSMTCPETTLA